MTACMPVAKQGSTTTSRVVVDGTRPRGARSRWTRDMGAGYGHVSVTLYWQPYKGRSTCVSGMCARWPRRDMLLLFHHTGDPAQTETTPHG
jgi:hypothetical protein